MPPIIIAGEIKNEVYTPNGFPSLSILILKIDSAFVELFKIL